MSASGRNTVIGIGRQGSGLGTPLTVPKFEHAMGSGRIGGTPEIGELPWSSSTEAPVGHFVESNVTEINLPGLPLLPKATYAWFLAALGTDTTVTTTHTATLGARSPQTLFYQQPSVSSETNKNFIRATDAFIDELTLRAETTGPLLLDAMGAGKAAPRAASKWSTATIEEASIPYFTATGATCLLDTAATPAATAFTLASGFSMNINRNADNWRALGSLGYSSLDSTKTDVVVEFGEVRPANNDQWNALFYGSASGADLSGIDQYGSLDITFPLSDGTATSSVKLQIKLRQLRFTATPVESDPSGTPVSYTLTGTASKAAASAFIEVIVLNAESGSTNY